GTTRPAWWRPSSVTAEDRNLSSRRSCRCLQRVAAVLRDGRGSQLALLGVWGWRGKWRPSSVTAEDRNLLRGDDAARARGVAAVLRDGRGSQRPQHPEPD